MTTVGILGGGQLARMLALSGASLGLRFLVVDPIATACAGQWAPLLVGDYVDKKILQKFVSRVDVGTFDFEHVPVQSAQWLAEHIDIAPSVRALQIAQDRLLEKNLFRELGIPVTRYADIQTRIDLGKYVELFGMPCILKTRRFGYDGKGQFRIKSLADIDAAWVKFEAQAQVTGLILEEFVPFEREFSILVVRGHDAELRIWPMVENWHVNGVLSASLVLEGVDKTLAEIAVSHVTKLVDVLDYVGVLALELFYCNGKLLANEMAPRVHNSGHWTIEGSDTSQFENHLRAVTRVPLGMTEKCSAAICMLNWIGKLPPAPEKILQVPGGHWHDYGKHARTGRKVGHATFRADSAECLAKILRQVATNCHRERQIAPMLQRLSDF